MKESWLTFFSLKFPDQCVPISNRNTRTAQKHITFIKCYTKFNISNPDNNGPTVDFRVYIARKRGIFKRDNFFLELGFFSLESTVEVDFTSCHSTFKLRREPRQQVLIQTWPAPRTFSTPLPIPSSSESRRFNAFKTRPRFIQCVCTRSTLVFVLRGFDEIYVPYTYP